MPFLGGIGRILAEDRPFRYPIKELTDWIGGDPERRVVAQETLGHFDTIRLATHCRVPTRMSLGLKDPAVRPWQVEEAFEALPGTRELVRLDWGHDWHPDMISGGRDWLIRHLS
jgi:cephalosporin-C deacetylase